MGCYYAGKNYQCDEQHCKGCINASNYHGMLGKRIYLDDKEVEETCNDCSCFYECFGEAGEFNLNTAKECYNIMFSCNEEDV